MAAPHSAFARKREATTSAILDATARIIAEKGLDAFTMSEIAERAKVNRSLIYHYFHSRESLVAQAIDYIIGQYEEAEPMSGVDSVEQSARMYIEHPEVARFVFQLLLAERPLLGLGERLTRTVAAARQFKEEHVPDAPYDPTFGVIVLIFAELAWAFSRQQIARLLEMSVETADQRFIDYLRSAAELSITMLTGRRA